MEIRGIEYMAITRKPAPSKPVSAVDVEELINRGGSSPVQQSEPSGEDGAVPVILRIPKSMLRNIDQVVKSRPVRIPRHTWILEALYEKLSRDTDTTSE
jgi:hypothetical protein